MSIEYGLGIRASDLENEQLVSVKKVRNMASVKIPSKALLIISRQALYAASILTLVVLTTAKASVALLLVAIRPPKPVLIASYVFVGLVVAWCLSGSIAIAFRCSPPSMAFSGSSNDKACIDRYALQLSVGTLDILTDIAIVVLAYYTMRGVQITLRRRASIVTLFGLRLTRSAALSQNESRSEPKMGKSTTSNTGQVAANDAQYRNPAVYTGSEDAHSRTRVRGGLPKEQAEETESMRGLTSDAIHERREFTLDFADGESRHSSLK